MNKFKLLSSSNTAQGIKDSIKRYFCNDKIIFHKLKDHYLIYQQDDDNDYICMKDYRVIIQNNRLKFQIMEVKWINKLKH